MKQIGLLLILVASPATPSALDQAFDRLYNFDFTGAHQFMSLCYGVYDAEPEHFTTYVDAILARGSAGVADYLERYVYGPASHADYLALFGEPRRADAAARARMLTT